MYSIFKSKYLLMGLASLVAFFAITTDASAAIYYFNNAVNTDPTELGNYWDDSAATIQSTLLAPQIFQLMR